VGVVTAFPGAQGGGALSVGGRGGTVYQVTNLNDSGAGSLRACVNASGPRTCLFRTGGTITLASSLTVANPFINIAGQTAPGGGIQLNGPNSAGDPTLLITTHDVVVQYLRLRRGHNPGEICNAMPWSCGTSLEVFSNSSATNPYNIMLDHISAEWSNYDAMIALGSNNTPNQPRSMTVSRSILGEALGGAGQTVGVNFGGYSGQGPTAPDGMTDLDLHHNLFAGTSHRMPLLTVKSARLVNNIVYAWTYYAMRGKGFRDFVNNYFKTRSVIAASHEIQAWTENAGNDTSFAPSFYLLGNVGPSDPLGIANWTMTALALSESGGEAPLPLLPTYQRSTPIPTPAGYIPITPDPVSAISSASGSMLNTARTAPYDGVGASRRLDCAGRWADAQDSVDSRIVRAVANGTNLYGSYDYSSLQASPQSQVDLGGWPALAAGTACADANNNGLPDLWESHWAGAFALGTVLDPNALNFGDGYTNLEHYLSGLNPLP
jgi:pectate lyase